MPGDLCTASGIISYLLSLATDLTDVTIGESDLWLGTRTAPWTTVAFKLLIKELKGIYFMKA